MLRGVIMRRKHCGSLLGNICIVVGIMIVLALILPSGFWWLLLGAGLIGFGIYLDRHCW